MIRLLYIFLSFILFSSLHAEKSFQSGKNWINEIHRDYKLGKYELFLRELHDAYLNNPQVLDTKIVQNLFREIAKNEKNKPTIDLIHELKKGRDYSLLQVANANKNEFISTLIFEMKEFEEANNGNHFKDLLSLYLIKTEGEDLEIAKQFLNKLSLISRAFAHHEKMKTVNQFIDITDEKKYQVVQAFDLLYKVPNLPLPEEMKASLKKCFSDFIKNQVISHNFDYLKGLAEGTFKPRNEPEKEVSKIIQLYLMNQTKLKKS